jgi:Flp pilus assembly protein TadB
MTIQTRNGQREQIDNMDFAGVGNFVDKSAEYRAAVAALTGQLKARGANVDVISGRSWPYYVLMVVLAGFFVLMLPVLIALGGPIGIVMVLIGLITVGPRTWRWFKLNRPQTGTLDALPPGSMP